MKFFHRIPGAKFHMPDGKELSFAGGVLDTDTIPEEHRSSVISELKKIANVPASMIFTVVEAVEAAERAVIKEIREGAEAAFDSVMGKKGGETVVIPVPEQPKPTLAQAGAAAEGTEALKARMAAAKAAVDGGAPAQSQVSKGPVSPAPVAPGQVKS